ncbi:hypothetical protein I552_7560 [Mycobacterium xenopi 3993]|nr:hypothetical protein I552_7560 [Mycobacterium xenopi 3993]
MGCTAIRWPPASSPQLCCGVTPRSYLDGIKFWQVRDAYAPRAW